MHSDSWLKCTGCGDKFGFSSDYVFQYTDLESETQIRNNMEQAWPVLLQPCWCVECNRPSFAERVPSLSEFIKAAAVRRIPEGPTKHEIQDELLYMDEELFAWHFETLGHRTEPEICLLCGTSTFIALDPWERKTPLRHDSCGSPLELHIRICGSIGRREFRYYSPNGKFLCAIHGVA